MLDDDDQLAGADELTAHGGQFDADELARELDQLDARTATRSGTGWCTAAREFTGPVRLDAAVRGRLDQLTDLAPLHQPKSLAGHRRGQPGRCPTCRRWPASTPPSTPPCPRPPRPTRCPRTGGERWQIRRYGFHGLSHAYATRRVSRADRPHSALRLVVCHLGAGASLAAVRDGRSVDTTMGFTPLEGLVMATRSGTVDPGLVLWLIEHERSARTT